VLLPRLLLLAALLLSPSAAAQGDMRSPGMPAEVLSPVGGLPDARLPVAGSAHLAARAGGGGAEAALGLVPLEGLALTLRQTAVDDGSADLTLRLWPEGPAEPGLLAGVLGLGHWRQGATPFLALGTGRGPLDLTGGLGWPWGGGALPQPFLNGRVNLAGGRMAVTFQAGLPDRAGRPRLGVLWRVFPWLDMELGWQAGRGLFSGMALRTGPALPPRPVPPPPAIAAGADGMGWVQAVPGRPLAADLARAARQTAPAPDGTVTLATHADGLPGLAVTLPAAPLLPGTQRRSSPAEIARLTTITPATGPVTLAQRWRAGLDLRLDQGPGPLDSGWVQRVRLQAGGALLPLPGVRLDALGSLGLADSTTRLPRPPPAGAVRSDLDAYVAHPLLVERLQASLYGRLRPDTAWLLRAGLLEEMFAGTDAALLVRPAESRLYLDLGLAASWKRRPGGVAPDGTAPRLTGHVRAGYDWGDSGASLTLGVERFLGGDAGLTLGIGRLLDDGTRLDADLVLADRPHLSLALRIPLGVVGGRVRTGLVVTGAPQGRDGAQRLERVPALPDLAGAAGYGSLSRSWRSMLDP